MNHPSRASRGSQRQASHPVGQHTGGISQSAADIVHVHRVTGTERGGVERVQVGSEARRQRVQRHQLTVRPERRLPASGGRVRRSGGQVRGVRRTGQGQEDCQEVGQEVRRTVTRTGRSGHYLPHSLNNPVKLLQVQVRTASRKFTRNDRLIYKMNELIN